MLPGKTLIMKQQLPALAGIDHLHRNGDLICCGAALQAVTSKASGEGLQKAISLHCAEP